MQFKNNNFRSYSSIKQILVNRTLITFFFILILFSAILVNLYFLQIVHFEEYQIKSMNNYIKLNPVAPRRGLIYDRNGIPLAINRSAYHLELVLKDFIKVNNKIPNIRKIFNITDKDLKKINKKSNMNTIISVAHELNEKQLYYFATNRYLLPNSYLKKDEKRYYPFGKTLTHVLGYVARINRKDREYLEKNKEKDNYIVDKNIGKLGIESYYEKILHGNSGYQQIKINSIGRKIKLLDERLPKSGKDIYLTIDIKLQQYIEKLLSNKGRIAVIASNPQNGEILAMVSTPSYDANLFINGLSTKSYNMLLQNKDLPLYNRAIQATYPPASTVKPYIALTALEAGIINKNTNIFDLGWWKMPGSKKYYHDWKKSGHGYINIIKSIEESSDTFFYQIAYNMGINYISQWMTKFGFGQYTGIDLPQENKGNMPTRNWKINRFHKPWYQGDTIPVGIGQGYWTATPLQMNIAMITLINNGVVKVPHILFAVKEAHSNKFYYNKPFSKNVIYSNFKYWSIVKQGMYGVANNRHGTAYQNFANAPYKIAAKSGTAQLFKLRKNETYNSHKINENLRDHKLMNAFAPYDKPRIAITIIMENSSNNKIGKIMRQILDYFLIYKNK
ncbi:penicillin-binding protein 2 [Candidatus Pantoea edessiphila]|uniref:Peptidoglycan D,D-transpeptidase MrdA n=1 Tax=Candidatus Pantoea edessiphila TaxID=2044610 RepID=A0A2P5SX39_9GAMM|nr:penicillin-binding protein 2 [Candidatus Pantoea edessiphila]PPI86901.1 penicillin-binding protein 2 [Candidatus Pantoea edessiphila]